MRQPQPGYLGTRDAPLREAVGSFLSEVSKWDNHPHAAALLAKVAALTTDADAELPED